MNIRTEIREVEKHIKSMTNDKNEQIAIISRAQGATADNEHNITVLAIAKNRINNADLSNADEMDYQPKKGKNWNE